MAWRTPQGGVLDLQHAHRRSEQPPRCSRIAASPDARLIPRLASLPRPHGRRTRTDRRDRHRLRRPRHGRRLRRARQRGLVRRRRRGQDRAACERGEIPIYEPGLPGVAWPSTASGCTSPPSSAPALEHARLLFVAVGTPPTYSGDADLSAVNAVVDAMPASDRHALVMKSTVPVGTGAAIRRDLRRAGQDPASPTSRAPSSSRRARRWRTSWRPIASSSATTATGPATPSSSSTRRSTRRSCGPTSPAPR